MGIEIERKFLVSGDGWRTSDGRMLCQGYLSRDPARTVRVRIDGEQAFLTIKGLSEGATRLEFEYAIPAEEARDLLKLADGPCVEKIRHRVLHQGLLWEVDEFLGDNAPLVLAEVELEREDQAVALPAWVGQEVTQDARYFNSALAATPYGRWSST